MMKYELAKLFGDVDDIFIEGAKPEAQKPVMVKVKQRSPMKIIAAASCAAVILAAGGVIAANAIRWGNGGKIPVLEETQGSAYISNDSTESSGVSNGSERDNSTEKNGSFIDSKVSNGGKMSEIYDFTNRPALYAIQQLEKEGFKITTVCKIDDNVAKDCVIGTNPPAHTMAEQGSTVVVIVSMGAKNDLLN